MEAKDGCELESRLLLRNGHGLLIVRLLAEDTAYLVEVVFVSLSSAICVDLRLFYGKPSASAPFCPTIPKEAKPPLTRSLFVARKLRPYSGPIIMIEYQIAQQLNEQGFQDLLYHYELGGLSI